MKNILLLLTVFICLASCETTKLTVSYTKPDIQPQRFSKLAVVAIVGTDHSRLEIEEAVVNQLNAIGQKTIHTFNIFPLASRQDVIADMSFTEEELEAHIQNKVKENEIDALLIISLLNTRTVERYVQKPVAVVGYYDPTYSAYNYRYYNYYSYVYSTTVNQGYYVTDATYFVESNLYETKTGELLWTGQSTTENMSSIETEAPNFAKIITRDMLEKKVLIRN